MACAELKARNVSFLMIITLVSLMESNRQLNVVGIASQIQIAIPTLILAVKDFPTSILA